MLLCYIKTVGSFCTGLLSFFCNFEKLRGNLALSELLYFLVTSEFAQLDESEIIIKASLGKIVMP